jgi:hypothetical protein
MTEQLAIEIIPSNRLLIAAEFHRLADVPPEIERFANIRNSSTRRAYEAAIRDFMQFTGIDDRLCEVFPSRGPRRSMAAIAIAAITKHEGFQWVQRQSGFDAS